MDQSGTKSEEEYKAPKQDSDKDEPTQPKKTVFIINKEQGITKEKDLISKRASRIFKKIFRHGIFKKIFIHRVKGCQKKKR